MSDFADLSLVGRSAPSHPGGVSLSVPDWLSGIADPVRLHIVHSLLQVQVATAADLAGEGSASKPTLRRHLEALLALGVITEIPGESDGETPGRPPSRFLLAPEVRAGLFALLG